MRPHFSEQTQKVLDQLHENAAQDQARWQARTGTTSAGQNAAGGGDLVRLGQFYLAVSPEEGRFLYLLARATKVKTIVEFGASYGISSIYLAAAAHANGGHLTTTEVHPDKCAALRETFANAGMSEAITLLEGDALKTLANVTGPVDLLFLDGWKSAYLPVLTLMRPKLAKGALILADNCDHEAAQDYRATVTDPDSDYITEFKGDLAMTFVAD